MLDWAVSQDAYCVRLPRHAQIRASRGFVVWGAFMAHRRNGYLKAVTYTALLEAAAMLRVRRCAHVMTAMTDHAVCVVCGAAFPWRRGEGGSDAED